ncbi:MAG: hypothetical protein ACKO96_17600 [Flammeovirgaceae bacterium]
MVRSQSLQATHLVVFASNRLRDLISGVKGRDKPMGFGGCVGNKGAVSISLMIGSINLCFISCHFHSKPKGVSQRNIGF